jgi:hypothetical protein
MPFPVRLCIAPWVRPDKLGIPSMHSCQQHLRPRLMATASARIKANGLAVAKLIRLWPCFGWEGWRNKSNPQGLMSLLW